MKIIDQRRAGVFLHPTCLPGPLGVGDLGPGVQTFLDWMVAAGQSVWQILPLAPTQPHQSPYDGLSVFAGNPLLISIQPLIDRGMLPADTLAALPKMAAPTVDFDRVKTKDRLLRLAWQELLGNKHQNIAAELEGFCQSASTASWLDDWAVFAALKDLNEGKPWWLWDEPVRDRQKDAIAMARERLSSEIEYHKFLQFLFFRQWSRTRELAQERGITILGELPMFASRDSADVWANRSLFSIDSHGQLLGQAGLPPHSSATEGMLWGRPLYRWARLEASGFRWWVDRLQTQLELFDYLRLDYFSSYFSYWKIPAGAVTAVNGEWIEGPGATLFRALARDVPRLPFVVEDPGVLSPEIDALRNELGLPLVKVLQRAFSQTDSEHLPHHHDPMTIVSTGTEEDAPARSWFEHLDLEQRTRSQDYLGGVVGGIEWELLRTTYSSVATLALVPFHDLVWSGDESWKGRDGLRESWRWRIKELQLNKHLSQRMFRAAELTGRLPS
jgi:4-alpha-glucanotransferase